MFTFGKEREIEHAINYLGTEEKAELLIDVIKCLHDFIDTQNHKLELKEKIVLAITEGKSGVWEQTASWLRKLCKDDHEFNEIWVQLSQHKLAKVRFRVACFLDDIEEVTFQEIKIKLINDPSKKVKEMVMARIDERNL